MYYYYDIVDAYNVYINKIYVYMILFPSHYLISGVLVLYLCQVPKVSKRRNQKCKGRHQDVHGLKALN